MTMYAVVLQVQCDGLLVLDLSSNQEVMVLTSDAGAFSVGNKVEIVYSGAMTFSLPPQISAMSIRLAGSDSSGTCQTRPTCCRQRSCCCNSWY